MRELLNVFAATLRRSSERHAALFSAGVAFYVFLSLFPALIAAVFGYGLVADAETMAHHAESLAKLLPEDASSILRRQLDDLAQDTPGKLGGGVIAALVVAFWSASRGAFNLLKAIQWIFGLGEVRSALRQRLLAFAMMVGTVVFITIAVGLIAAIPPILELLQLEGAWRLLRSARWLFLTATVVASIGVLFRLAEGAPIRIRTVLSPGVVVATALWIVVSFGFSIYVDVFADYTKTYGALTGVVVLMMWIWLGTFSVLFGAAFESVLRERRGG